jgi:hypothetical protein
MVSMELVSREVARLGGLDRFPRKPEALKELALSFQRKYGTHPELTVAIDDVLHTMDTCPKPSHVYGTASGQPNRSGLGCELCDYTGFVTRTDRQQTIDGMRDVPIAHFCSCHPGGRRSPS